MPQELQTSILYIMWCALLLLSASVAYVHSHGRVLQPPSRASAWRYGFPTKPNYDDDGLNCGGFSHQWSVNGGKCGICGDPYDAPTPRAHELGGVYGDGVIVEHYLPGSVFTTTVDMTASHRGYWEFKLCPDPSRNDQECFDEYVLELEEGGNSYRPDRGSSKYEVNYRLPSGLVCDHCVLQWRYTAGNNWGDCNNGTQALGCGNQEQFFACSDISIGVSKTQGVDTPPEEFEDIPYPLLYYLRNGYFDGQGGTAWRPPGINGTSIPQQPIGLPHQLHRRAHPPQSPPVTRSRKKKKTRRKNKKKIRPHKLKKMLHWG